MSYDVVDGVIIVIVIVSYSGLSTRVRPTVRYNVWISFGSRLDLKCRSRIKIPDEERNLVSDTQTVDGALSSCPHDKS